MFAWVVRLERVTGIYSCSQQSLKLNLEVKFQVFKSALGRPKVVHTPAGAQKQLFSRLKPAAAQANNAGAAIKKIAI